MTNFTDRSSPLYPVWERALEAMHRKDGGLAAVYCAKREDFINGEPLAGVRLINTGSSAGMLGRNFEAAVIVEGLNRSRRLMDNLLVAGVAFTTRPAREFKGGPVAQTTFSYAGEDVANAKAFVVAVLRHLGHNLEKARRPSAKGG